ncbi:hypothetical protein NX801_16430 [Streptomyces sp. LP05-1]|uniref:Uncharacterized protein n=1 Tax=Streptomyces pyxinae TaxID=2970734 RepID=A0ABT2CII8_9ACTN|nr:hypothetical protein [Streptomyces sp. LP05-1]MCS0637220.1 hypothetical protein [Streptomyces sp. LP05-1]
MTLDTPYRAIFCDLLTDQTLDILPLRDVTLDDFIGKPGSLSGTVPIPDAAIAARVRRVAEGRTAVYLERGGDLWWGGIIWTSTLASSERGVLTLGIQAATFDSYAARRRIRKDLSYPATDQLEVARELWRELQSAPGGDIRVDYGSETSGVLRKASWRDGDETPYSEALEQLAAPTDGFEHHIAVYRDPVTGERVRRLRLGSPRVRTGATDLLLDRPGAILSYAFPRDATRGGTTARARGASVNNNQAEESRPLYSAEKVAGDLLAAGWPRVDLSSDHNEVGDRAALDSLAATELAEARGAVVIPEITVRLDGVVPPALLGRTARVRITDEWFPEGLDVRYRIIGCKVQPAERGRPDTAELYLEVA